MVPSHWCNMNSKQEEEDEDMSSPVCNKSSVWKYSGFCKWTGQTKLMPDANNAEKKHDEPGRAFHAAVR